jgi:hypothetical protein
MWISRKQESPAPSIAAPDKHNLSGIMKKDSSITYTVQGEWTATAPAGAHGEDNIQSAASVEHGAASSHLFFAAA